MLVKWLAILKLNNTAINERSVRQVAVTFTLVHYMQSQTAGIHTRLLSQLTDRECA